MSNILFPLDTTLWQQYHTVLCFKFVPTIHEMSIVFHTSENTKTTRLLAKCIASAKCETLKVKLLVFPEHAKHYKHFHSKITLVDITIKYILSLAEEYQRYCFCLIVPYGNTNIEYNVSYFLEKYMIFH